MRPEERFEVNFNSPPSDSLLDKRTAVLTFNERADRGDLLLVGRVPANGACALLRPQELLERSDAAAVEGVTAAEDNLLVFSERIVANGTSAASVAPFDGLVL